MYAFSILSVVSVVYNFPVLAPLIIMVFLVGISAGLFIARKANKDGAEAAARQTFEHYYSLNSDAGLFAYSLKVLQKRLIAEEPFNEKDKHLFGLAFKQAAKYKNTKLKIENDEGVFNYDE